MTQPTNKDIASEDIQADPDVARIEGLVAGIITDFCREHRVDQLAAPSKRFNPGGRFTLGDDLADILVRELRRDGAKFQDLENLIWLQGDPEQLYDLQPVAGCMVRSMELGARR